MVTAPLSLFSLSLVKTSFSLYKTGYSQWIINIIKTDCDTTKCIFWTLVNFCHGLSMPMLCACCHGQVTITMMSVQIAQLVEYLLWDRETKDLCWVASYLRL